MYKFVIVFLCLVTVSYQAELSEEDKKELDKHHEDCAKETGVDEEILKKARKGEFEDDEKLKEQLFCVAKKVGFQDEDGEIKLDEIKEKVSEVLKDEKQTEELISKCAVKKETPQETAFEAHKCYFEITHIV